MAQNFNVSYPPSMRGNFIIQCNAGVPLAGKLKWGLFTVVNSAFNLIPEIITILNANNWDQNDFFVLNFQESQTAGSVDVVVAYNVT